MAVSQKDKILFASILIICVIELTGLIGLNSSLQLLFMKLTPLSLLISLALFFINQHHFRHGFRFYFALVFLLGFFIEVIGVKTGIIFGNYAYGGTLGLKLFDVPLLIGANWFMLIYSTGTICYQIKQSIFVKSLIGAGMMVVLDLFIEPVAMKYNFWMWRNGIIPVQNYVAWFMLSFVLLLLFYVFSFVKHNKFANAFFFVQLCFFILLNIF